MAIKIAGTEVINDNRELVLAKLTEINTSIADTAVDIFVYDTRKDSDGGAWRKRTQHTSWYNETLNTATRGSRKEFPAVAVIVCENTQVTIYDGDDPDLPMWMVFNTNTVSGTPTKYSFIITGSISSVAAKNGLLSIGRVTYVGVDFVGDRAAYNSDSIASNYGGANIKQRNNALVHTDGISHLSTGTIVSQTVNDVAMTVLPNAPIDAATGLPVPTIAVATAGGVSVILDSGSVTDSASSLGFRNITFDDTNGIYYTRNTTVGVGFYSTANDYSSGDGFGDEIARTSIGTNDFDWLTYSTAQSNRLNFGRGNLAFGGSSITGTAVQGLSLYDPVISDFTKTSACLITSTYNTGWMNGDIKLATLSDTDATNVTGAELVTNGTFDTDTSGWTALNSATLSVVSGALRISQTTVNYGRAEQAITVEVGKTYTVSVELKGGTGAARVILGTTSEGTQYYIGSVLTAAQTISTTFTATTTTAYLTLTNDTTTDNTYYDFDNISVRLAEEDRSVNGNGLQVFGTVTKSAVATGADLVAYSYSSSSTSNYLMQPYNSDLAFGTGDFSVMFWTKAADYTPNGSGVNFVIGLDTDLGAVTNKGAISIASSTANDLRFQIYQQGYASGGRIDCIDTDAIPTNTWNCICAVRRSGVFEIWLNGKLKATNSANLTADVSNLNTDGWHILSSNQQDVQMSLLRASATAPSPEQIKKIYEDEKVLFQDNAQATLYGSSDAVTALAYDDSTDLLHVGTSAGRSVFQGLRRVDNTTTAVGAAISASNGLVAED